MKRNLVQRGKEILDRGFLEYWKESKSTIDVEVAKKIPKISHFGAKLEEAVMGGKRLRGTLVLLTCEALEGDVEDAVDRAVAIELVHSASLIHDDYIDRHENRRGEPTLWRVIDPRRAVLLADLLFSMAQLYMEQKSRRDAMLLAEAIRNTVGGAVIEPLNPADLVKAVTSNEVSSKLYESIIRFKTGSLFAAACKAGALAARKSNRIQRDAYNYGMKMGEAYQIADDLRDLRDLAEGKGEGRLHVAEVLPALYYFDKSLFSEAIVSLVPIGELDSETFEDALVRSEDKFMTAVTERIDQAVEFLGNFPNNKHTSYLEKAPRELTKIMLEIG